MKKKIISMIIKEIQNAKTIVLILHLSPDGDALGSGAALFRALKELGKDVDLVIPEYPDKFDFMPSLNESIKKPQNKKYDLAIAIDCASIERLAGNDEMHVFERAKVTIVIDHHISNTRYGMHNLVENKPACAQIMYRLIKSLRGTIDKEEGICLITGIITDTGGFKFKGVDSETFEIASDLLKIDVDISKIYRNVLEIVTLERFNLENFIRNRITFEMDGKVAYAYLTKEDEEKAKSNIGDESGMANIGLTIKGVEVSYFIKEIEKINSNNEKEKICKVEIRSREYVDVSKIAVKFGGGGHFHASGCKIKGSIDENKEKLMKEIRKNLNM